MRPNISEFSFGYAVTDELIHWTGTPLTAAPVFPSLREEGQASGGWDLRLDRPGIPLFLQFKLSDCLVRGTARDAHYLQLPHYRMHLRPSRFSDQHQMLLNLEQAGHEVYYVAPTFHEPAELNDAYAYHQLLNRSVWIPPSWIGSLPDEKDHYVAFQGNRMVFRSEPRILEGNATSEGFYRRVRGSIRERGATALREDSLQALAAKIEGFVMRSGEFPVGDLALTREPLADRGPLQRAAYYSHVFVGAEVFVLHEREG